jgi:hypothetical protein
MVVRDENHLPDVWNLRVRDKVKLPATWRRLDDEAELLVLALANSDHAGVHGDDVRRLDLPVSYVGLLFILVTITFREFRICFVFIICFVLFFVFLLAEIEFWQCHGD